MNGFEMTSREASPSYLLHAGGARLRSGTEVVHGVPCYVIDAETEYGTFSFWIDPSRGWNVAKAEGHRQSGHKGWNGYAKLPRKVPNGGGITIIGEDFWSESTEFVKMGTRTVAGNVKYSFSRSYDDGTTSSQGGESRRFDLTATPDFERAHALELDFPNGTPVFFEAHGGVAHEWRDGEICPITPERDLKAIDEAIDRIRTKRPAATTSKN
jgi:hypothetical protein